MVLSLRQRGVLSRGCCFRSSLSHKFPWRSTEICAPSPLLVNKWASSKDTGQAWPFSDAGGHQLVIFHTRGKNPIFCVLSCVLWLFVPSGYALRQGIYTRWEMWKEACSPQLASFRVETSANLLASVAVLQSNRTTKNGCFAGLFTEESCESHPETDIASS